MFTSDIPSPFPHPKGEPLKASLHGHIDVVPITTPAGIFHVRWDQDVSVTAHGGLAGFVDFLDATKVFEEWVNDCPLYYESNNAPSKRDILGTMMLSLLSGHSRYAHVTSLRADGVSPTLLQLNKIVSEDSLRRGLDRFDAESARSWQQPHLVHTYLPMLEQDWVLDVDVTIKPLHGYQEGAVVSYNPHKPGRPSHAYHTYLMGGTRLILDVEVTAGNEHNAAHTRPGLWHWLEKLPRSHWPQLLRGDCGFGSEHMMAWPELNKLPYLFKQRLTSRTKILLSELALSDQWEPTAGGWEGCESTLRLSTWTRKRRVIVLRKFCNKRYQRTGDPKQHEHDDGGGMQLCIELDGFGERDPREYHYQVLVTTLTQDIPVIAQLYRDRADCENVFDELKNQWGWAGFTTKDLKRSQIVARMGAQIYNWWSIFVRLASPEHHREAITSRPMLMQSIARKTESGGQRFLSITSTHAAGEKVAQFFKYLAHFLKDFRVTAEQLESEDRWKLLMQHIFAGAFGTVVGKPP